MVNTVNLGVLTQLYSDISVRYDADNDTVELHYDGAWYKWRQYTGIQNLILYNAGNIAPQAGNIDLVGFGQSSAYNGYTIGSDYIYLWTKGGSTGSRIAGSVELKFTNPIHLTKFSSINFEAILKTSDGVAFNFIKIYDTTGTSLVKNFEIANRLITKGDISNLTGEYIVAFGMTNSGEGTGRNGNTTITRIWLDTAI